MIDSKGFLQPVYLFHTLLNGEETTIVILAMLKEDLLMN